MSKKRKTTKKQSSHSPRKSNRLLWILGGVVLFIAAAAGAYFISGAVAPRTDPQQATSQQPTVAPPKVVITPADVTEKIRASYDGRYKLLNLDENNQPNDGELSFRITQESPLYRTDGYSFYNDYDNGSAILFATYQPTTDAPLPTAADMKLRTEIATLLTEMGLTKDNESSSVYMLPSGDTYIGDDLFCNVDKIESASSATGVSCGKISDYAAAAAEYKPFVELIPENPAIEEATQVSRLAIQNSSTEGYKIASMSHFNAVALFYKATDGNWTYFTTTQSILSCSDYDSIELRTAFRAEPCVNSEQQTVKLF